MALLSVEGKALWSSQKEARFQASYICLSLLEEGLAATDLSLSEASGFLADLGPGSFTGVKVGVTLAKILAFTQGVLAGGLSSFDLISTTKTVVIPSKKGEYFVRTPGETVVRRAESMIPGEALGYGIDLDIQQVPLASSFSANLDLVQWIAPDELVPSYLIEPSISIPRKHSGGAVA